MDTIPRSRDIARWLAYSGFAICLAIAAWLNGGVNPSEWQWIAAIISLASLLCLAVPSRRTRDHGNSPELVILTALLLWMLFQLVPLPPALVAFLSFDRWNSALAARAATGSTINSWLPLSVAPAATLERLLYVVPAMAAFVSAREMGRWWGGRRLWILVAPVIGVALMESWFGFHQISSVAADSAGTNPVRGTYVNRNHFAGLLELALPLAIMWAVAIWRKEKKLHGRVSESPAILAIGLFGIAACLLAMVAASLSRMGFIACLSAIAAVGLAWVYVRSPSAHARKPRWTWLPTAVLPVVIFALFASDALVLRFADTPGVGEISADGRTHVWKETVHLISAYRWTGTGLGGFEQGLYPFRHSDPDLTFDFAHNDYLQALAELGVVGGLLAIALAAWILWKPLSVILKRGSSHRELAVGLIGSLVAIGIHSLVDFNLYIPANALAVAWLAGVSVSPGLGGGQ